MLILDKLPIRRTNTRSKRKPLAAWRQRFACAGVFLAGLLAAATGQSAGMQSLESIRQAVQVYLEQRAATLDVAHYEISVGQLDSRLQLPDCNEKLKSRTLQDTRQYGRITVMVECNAPKPWTLHVAAEIKAYAEVLAATRLLTRNEIIKAGDFEKLEHDLTLTRGGYYHNAEDVIGKVVTRTIGPGKILAPSMLAAPNLVKRGDDIIIIANTPAMEVRMKGTALSNGILGERVKVRNLGSKRVVEGTVVESGIVRVAL